MRNLDLFDKIKQTYPKLMKDVIDIKLATLPDGRRIVTLQHDDIMKNKYPTFADADEFKRKMAKLEAKAA